MVDNPRRNEEDTSVTAQSDLIDVPHVYANGFQIGVSNADISLVLKLDNRPTHVVHLSYTLAKTLEKKIGGVVAQFEEAVGRDMLVTDEVDKAFRALADSKAEPGE
ncbi:MAG: hypothetical protein WEA34_08780 [Gemmatimonadota bacterium]